MTTFTMPLATALEAFPAVVAPESPFDAIVQPNTLVA